MNSFATTIGLGTLLAGVGFWLLLPRGAARSRAIGGLGAGLAAIGLGLTASQTPGLGDLGASCIFYLLAAVTVVSAVATVSCASPVYSAIWFALTLLGSAAALLFQGAQFLGIATVVVYAGAILVTFLFVLMLAQPSGNAPYDRLSWEAPLSAAAGALIIGVLTFVVSGVFQHPSEEARPEAVVLPANLEHSVLTQQHMALLGAQLFSKQLISVEIAGTLLLVGLVGCVSIVFNMHRPKGKTSLRPPANSLLASGPADGIVAAVTMSSAKVSGPEGSLGVTTLSITRGSEGKGSSHG